MIKILPIHHVVPLVFLMPKWNSLYCISLGGWRMIVVEGSQKSIVLFLQRAECVQLLMELRGYQPGLAHTQGCAELCLAHCSNWPLLESYFIWIVLFETPGSKLLVLSWPVQSGNHALCLPLMPSDWLWRYRETNIPCWLLLWQIANNTAFLFCF